MNLLIVDDEAAGRAVLVELCQRSNGLRVVGEATSGGEGIKAVEFLRPDLVLLNADLPDMSGFEVLRALSASNQRRTILVTNSAETATAAFSAGAVDYLLKPVSPEAFSKSILRVSSRLNLRPATRRAETLPGGSLTVERGIEQGVPFLLVGEREHRLYPLDPVKIDYVESAGNYVTYRVGGSEYIAREAIKSLEDMLRSWGFIRIERSLLLNIRAVAYVQPAGRSTFTFTLASGVRLRSGPAFRETILNTLPLRRRASPRPGPSNEVDTTTFLPGRGHAAKRNPNT